jgi:hypothetical protein
VRLAEQAAPRLDRAGEGALLVAEQLRLQERGRQRGAVEGDERALGARPQAVERARQELLAGAALAHDEDRGVGGGHPLDERDELHHRRRVADQLAEAARPLHLGAEAAHLAGQVAALGGPLDGGAQLGGIHRLAQVVVGAGAHRLDRLLDPGVGGEQDERQIGRGAAQAAQELEAAGPRLRAGQIFVDQHHVVRRVVRQRQRLVGVPGAVHLDLLTEEERDEPVDLRLAVHHQDAARRRRLLAQDALPSRSGSRTRAWVPTPSFEV